jgi:hypothetical protein
MIVSTQGADEGQMQDVEINYWMMYKRGEHSVAVAVKVSIIVIELPVVGDLALRIRVVVFSPISVWIDPAVNSRQHRVN